MELLMYVEHLSLRSRVN